MKRLTLGILAVGLVVAVWFVVRARQTAAPPSPIAPNALVRVLDDLNAEPAHEMGDRLAPGTVLERNPNGLFIRAELDPARLAEVRRSMPVAEHRRC